MGNSEKKMRVRKEIIIILLVLSLSVAIIFNFLGFDFHPQTLSELDYFTIIGINDFTSFALVVNFLYSVVPNTLQLLSISGITVRLLQSGFSPIVLGFVIAVGSLVSQLILYGVGLFFYRHVRRKKGDNASATHFLHKYHYLVFLIPSWTGSLGDLIMLVSGHERVNLIKAVPFLFSSNLAYSFLTVYWINAQL